MREGLSCPATIWKVHCKASLEGVRDAWSEQWTQCLERHGDNLKPAIPIICNVLLAICKCIQESGLSSLADSIWLSTRREILKCQEPFTDRIELPDTFSEVLADSVLSSQPENLFEFKWDDSGSFLEIWIIERALRQGCIWFGEAQRNRDEDFVDESGSTVYKQEMTAREARAKILKSSKGKKTLASRMITKVWGSRFAGLSGIGDDDNPRLGSGAALMMFVSVMSYGRCAAPLQDLRGELAAFDIDGPATIGIPYDLALEVLPRAVERSMSVCWVVEQDLPAEKTDGDVPYDSNAAKQSREDPSGKALENPDPGSEQKQNILDKSREQIRYKVLRKVRGCWPVMELQPTVQYLFV